MGKVVSPGMKFICFAFQSCETHTADYHILYFDLFRYLLEGSGFFVSFSESISP
jgi:hypothetical protein